MTIAELPRCKWRGSLVNGLYPCSTPRLIGVEAGVSGEFCRTRCPYVDHEVNYKHAVPRLTQCVHLGDDTGRKIECGSCSGRVQLKVAVCWKHGECVRNEGAGGVRGCKSCTDFAPASPVIPIPSATVRVDSARLAKVYDGRLHNSSILNYHGRKLLCYRGGLRGSRLFIATLGADWQPLSNVAIELQHDGCEGGQEDPRLFVHEGRLHLCFAGIEMVGSKVRVNMMLAILDDDLVVERVWEMLFNERSWLEKNWGLFSFGGSLLAVYTISPHVVLEVSGGRISERRLCAVAHESTGPPGWIGGEEFRGGAAPVRHGDEFFCFFHSWHRSGFFGSWWFEYAVGVYTFDAWPPFRVRRICPGPILRGDRKESPLVESQDKNVIFPCGAILDGGTWVVSYGVQDSFCDLGFFSAESIAQVLEPVLR